MAVMRAVWNGAVVAESDRTVYLEGNHYFPWDAVDHKLLRPSAMKTVCPWKGVASYYDLVVHGRIQTAAGWVYRTPSTAAAEIGDHIAFWKDVTVESAELAESVEAGGAAERVTA